MNKLVKIARVISDSEAREKGFSDRHEMYKHLDMARETSGPMSLRERLFEDESRGTGYGALSGMASFLGLGAIPGVMGQLADRNINLELSARETDEGKARLKRLEAGSVLGRTLKGAIGGTLLGPLGGAVAGQRMGGNQRILLEKIRVNRED